MAYIRFFSFMTFSRPPPQANFIKVSFAPVLPVFLFRPTVLWPSVLRIRIEKMRMRIQEKISMRMRMQIHALTELWLASNSIRNL